MKRKGFTLIELLVVIAIIALLMSILMPALARVREMANRVVCGTNLKGIGTAAAIYGGDDESGRFPAAGGRTTLWGNMLDWTPTATNAALAWGIDPATGGGGAATITSTLYLLVKYDYTTAKQFKCHSDPDTGEEFRHGQPFLCWDFDDDPGSRCSYAYQMCYYNTSTGTRYALSSASNPGLAMAADRNPWQIAGILPNDASLTDKEKGNSAAHGREGQNVLYVDGHVLFERSEGSAVQDRGCNCGLNDDDIYTTADAPLQAPVKGTSVPLDREDSLLVNEPLL